MASEVAAAAVETVAGQRDKYIGLALAISSAFAIGSSMIITKIVRQARSINVPALFPWVSGQSKGWGG